MRRFPGIVAALVPCMASCGTVEKFTDAGMLDATAVDADVSIDANPPGQVTVTAHSRCCDAPSGSLVAGVQVFVIQPDGTLGDSGVTDAAGLITLDDVQAGAGITAVYPPVGLPADIYIRQDLVSVVGVKPGDNLVLGESYAQNRTGSTGDVTVHWPTTPGTYYFAAQTACSSNYVYDTAATSLTLPVYAGCGATADVIVHRLDNTSYRVAGSAMVRGGAFTPGADLGTVSFSAPIDLAASVAALPAYVTSAQFESTTVLSGFNATYDSQSVQPSDGAAGAALRTPPGGDSIAGTLYLYRPGEYGSQVNIQSFAPTATAAPFTMVELPWVGDGLVSAGAQFVTWVQLGTQPYDGAVAQADWRKHTDGPDGGEGYYTDYDWTVLLPPGITTFSWTAVPAEVAAFLPGVGDNLDADISLVELASVPSYDALRATAEWTFSDPQSANARGELTGRATVSNGRGNGNGSGSGAAPTRPLLDRIPVQGTRSR